MNTFKSLYIRSMIILPIMLTSLTALAGGGGGSQGAGAGGGASAPEPGFLAMCAVVAGTELGRRIIKRNRQ